MPAAAWLSLRVKADNATVELGRDGTAQVNHELLLHVRGGPLKEFALDGVDADAAPLGDATITRARSGQAAGPPVLLVPSYHESQVSFELSAKRGVGTGTYLVRFAYQTNLGTRELLHRAGDRVDVHWEGLSFTDGIDSLQTTFVVPRASVEPRLVAESGDDAVGMVVTDEGVFLSEVSRGAEHDRLQLTRPHVAKGERVNWKVRVASDVFESASVTEEGTQEAPPPAVAPLPKSTPVAMPHPWLWLAAVLGGLLFSLLVALRQRLGVGHFVFRFRAWARYMLIAVCMGASLAAALVYEQASLAGVGLIASMLLTLQKSRRPPIEPKGPGRWRPVQLDEVELPTLPKLARLRWLDASSGVGLVVFALALVGFGIAGLRLLGTSPYHSAMTLVYSTALVPLFFTLGTASHRSLVEEQCEFLIRLVKRLRRRKGLELEAVGRYGLDRELPDELRLRVGFAEARAGLISVEVGLGFVDTSLRRLLVPAVIVRVREDSAAHQALPRDAHWSRGRSADERVAVVRAPLPLQSSCIETLGEVVARLREPKPTRKRRPRSSHDSQSRARSRASGNSTSKLLTPSLPSHVSR